MSDPIWAARARGGLIVLFLTVAGLLGYAVRQHYAVQRLSAENDAMIAALKDTRTQMESLTARLEALTPPAPATEAAPPKPAPAHAQHAVGNAGTRRSVAVRNRTNERLNRLQTQMDAQGRAIESTRDELSTARNQLQDGIARTHEELVGLEKKGERSYFEFDLDKSKQFQRSGPVGVSLRKANTKHQYADLELRVEDAQVSQKHVNLLQPVVFYNGEQGRPVELVINSITRNHIHGYISAPKYTTAELAANGDGNGTSAPPATPAPAPDKRPKLELSH